MTKEDIQEYLDCNGFEALTAFDGTKYYNEKTVLSIALEIVKNCSIPNVSNRYSIEDIEKCVEHWGLCKVEKEYIERFLNGC